MSYDIGFRIKDDKERLFDIDDKCTFELNITYNVREIFVLGFENENGIKILEGKNIIEVKEKSKKAMIKLIDFRKDAIELEPSNGYGNYNNVISFLLGLILNCQELIDKGYDDAIIFIY